MAKVLFVCHVYPRHADDHQAGFMHDVAMLAARDHEVLVLAPHDEGLPMEEVRDGVRIVRFRYAPDPKETLAYRGDMHEQVLRRPARALLFARFLRRWRAAIQHALEAHRPDLVHVHWWIPGGLVARTLCLRAGIPYAVSSHGTDVFLLRKAPPARALARRVFGDAAAVHAVSSAIRSDIARFVSDRDAQRTHIFTMPVDVAALGAVRRVAVRHRVLFVGRLVERKGAHVLIEAVRRMGHPVSLHIVGEGPARPQLEAQATAARRHGVDVRVLGAVSRERLEQEYGEASVFCLPSITTARGESEGLGVVLLEAMAAGVPVVATDSGGIVDAVIDGQTGLLVSQGDAAALATALQRILDDARLAKRLVDGARARLEHTFGHDAIAARLSDLYAESLVAREGPRDNGGPRDDEGPRADGEGGNAASKVRGSQRGPAAASKETRAAREGTRAAGQRTRSPPPEHATREARRGTQAAPGASAAHSTNRRARR